MGRPKNGTSCFIDMTGQVFNRWLVVRYCGKGFWFCKCSCGAERTIVGKDVRSGHSKSCGCLKKELTSDRFRKHGMAGAPVFRTWDSMRQRCYNPKNNRYHDWGGRGITVCDRWKDSFENFYEDMGDKPTPTHSIDRIDNNGNYCPENCRWATVKEQNANKRKYKLRKIV